MAYCDAMALHLSQLNRHGPYYSWYTDDTSGDSLTAAVQHVFDAYHTHGYVNIMVMLLSRVCRLLLGSFLGARIQCGIFGRQPAHTHTHTHSLSLSVTHSRSLSLSLSLSLCPFLSLSLSLCPSLSLSVTHSRTPTPTPTHSYSYSLTHSLYTRTHARTHARTQRRWLRCIKYIRHGRVWTSLATTLYAT